MKTHCWYHFQKCRVYKPGTFGNGTKGFTLIETLLAITLFSIVMAACYGIFSMGISIWKRSQGSMLVERKTALALERMATETRSMYLSSIKEIKGSGSPYQFKAPGVVPTGANEPAGLLGLIQYEWDPSKRELCRSEITISDQFQKNQVPCKVIASQIKQLRFQYLLYSGIGDSYAWYDKWEEDDPLPIALKIEMQIENKLKNGKAEPVKNFSRLIRIPIGGKA